VVTGTMFTTFPADTFKIIKPGGVDKETIVPPGEKLKPAAAGLPGQVVKPTGFYKVILRPGRDGEPARAVGFLVPHTRTAMNASYRNFIARIDVVEDGTGFAFGVPDALKGAGGQEWWLARLVPKNWVLRAKTCPADSRPEGWQPDLSRDQRINACHVSAGGGGTGRDTSDPRLPRIGRQGAGQEDRVPGAAGESDVGPSVERQVGELRAALVEHQKTAEQQAGRLERALTKNEGAKSSPLEIVANGGLGVAAIFFGFFGFLMGALPGATDQRVRNTYWRAALTTGIGVLTSLGASILATLALWSGSRVAAGCSLALAVAAAVLVLAVTLYFLWQLARG